MGCRYSPAQYPGGIRHNQILVQGDPEFRCYPIAVSHRAIDGCLREGVIINNTRLGRTETRGVLTLMRIGDAQRYRERGRRCLI